MDSSLLYIEEIFNVDVTPINRRRFTIKCEQDRTKWMIFSSDHFGTYTVGTTNKALLVVSEVAGTANDKLLHFYAIYFRDTLTHHFYNHVYSDTKVDFNAILADTAHLLQ